MTRERDLTKIYPITDPYVSGISHLEQVKKLARGGARMVQLRDKCASSAAFYAAAAECAAFGRDHDVLIIVNDRVDIAIAAGADGVHLGQDDMPVEAARRVLGENAIIGFSTHTTEQATAALAYPVDYIAIGPVFATHTKAEPDPVIGVDGLSAVREIVREGLVAIGGIDEENIDKVLQYADSAAIVSALIRDPDRIEEKMRLLMSTTMRSNV